MSIFSEISPREALWLAEARQIEAWNHTASLMCTVASLFSERPLSPMDFHPMADKIRAEEAQPESNWSETIAMMRGRLGHAKRG